MMLFFFVILELVTPIHFHWMKESSLNILQRFSLFVSHGRKSVIRVCYNMRVREWCQGFHFWVDCCYITVTVAKAFSVSKLVSFWVLKKRHGKCFIQPFLLFFWYQTRNVFVFLRRWNGIRWHIVSPKPSAFCLISSSN